MTELSHRPPTGSASRTGEEAALDHLVEAVVAECAHSNLTALEVPMGAVESTELAVALAQIACLDTQLPRPGTR